jgi:release factor glutamine methyltransferase
VVSNPPYLSTDEWPGLDPVVREYDPYDALVAGPTGLEVICLLVAEAPAWLHAAGVLVVEIAPHQASAALQLARAADSYASAEVLDDLAGRPRVLVARRAA